MYRLDVTSSYSWLQVYNQLEYGQFDSTSQTLFIETHLCLLFHMLQALQKMMALNSISLPEDDTFFNTHIPIAI